jgi:hypothetical protein
MEHSKQIEASKCRNLAAEMRIDATRATLPGLAGRLLRGADDLERHAVVLCGYAPVFF